MGSEGDNGRQRSGERSKSGEQERVDGVMASSAVDLEKEKNGKSGDERRKREERMK